jgi:acetolactate synthase-1/2/3 large subunit
MKPSRTRTPKTAAARGGNSKAAPSSQASGSRLMSGADTLVASLERAGVEVIFAYPGGASMMLHQSLTRSKQIRTILPRHEQGGVFMAGGYARSTGKVGVCMATSGPGATNLVTGIADAWMDSVPLVAITGQVARDSIGRGAFQETDVFGMTLPVVKHSYLVMDPADIPRIVAEAFHIATSGRPGPVVIDIPKDVQRALCPPVFPDKVTLRGFPEPPKADDVALHEILGLIEKAERPVLYVGGGIITGEASDELRKFAEATDIPVTTTLMGIGCFPEGHRQSMKWLGMHGSVYANYAVDESDLLLAFGVRFDDRVTGKVSEFAKHATIVHIDVDNSEINKNKKVHLPVLSDVRYALGRLNELIRKERRPRKTFPKWHAKIDGVEEGVPVRIQRHPGRIQPQQVMRELHRLTKGEAIITVGVGQHQMWAGQFTISKSRAASSPRRPRGHGLRLSRSARRQGGLPRRRGHRHRRRRQLPHERAGTRLTRTCENIAAKAIILNNQHLGMVVQWEDRFFDSNRGHTFLGAPDDTGASIPITPDLRGLRRVRARHPQEGPEPALQRMLDAKGRTCSTSWCPTPSTCCR